MTYHIKENDDTEIGGKGFGIVTARLVELLILCSAVLLMGPSSLDQNKPTLGNFSRGSIFHAKFIVILISQAKIKLRLYSFPTSPIHIEYTSCDLSVKVPYCLIVSQGSLGNSFIIIHLA